MIVTALLVIAAQLVTHRCAPTPSPTITVLSPARLTVSQAYFHQSVTLAAGSDLVIRCSAPHLDVGWGDGDMDILKLTSLVSADAGLYECCVNKIRSQCSNIYVFVRSAKSSSQLISRRAGEPIAMSVIQSQSVVIPCIPNDPESKLSLTSMATRRDISETQFGVKFDPTVGFTLMKPTWTFEWVHMRCSTTRGEDTLDVIAFWHVAPASAPSVHIEGESNKPTEGSTIHLKCHITTSGATVVHIHWLFQNHILSPSERITVTTEDEGPEFVSHLLIQNMTISDSGSYLCRAGIAGSPQPDHKSDPYQIQVKAIEKRQDVKPRPLFLKSSSQAMIDSGSNLSLSAIHEPLVGCSNASRSWKILKDSLLNQTARDVTSDRRLSVDWGSENFTLVVAKVEASDSGLYSLFLHACDRNGSITFDVKVADSPAHEGQEKQVPSAEITSVYIGVLVCSLILLILSMFFLLLWKACQPGTRSTDTYLDLTFCVRHRRTRSAEALSNSSVCEDYRAKFTALIIPGAELSFDKDLLGAGAFGCVSRAEFRSQEVAVKKLKVENRQDEAMSLVEEMAILDHIQSAGTHRNIVAMVGVVFDPEIMIVFEYCLLGNLKNFLQSADFVRPTLGFAKRIEECMNHQNKRYIKFDDNSLSKQRIRVNDLFLYAVQVSKALEFLGSKGVIHRDIAARNVLVSTPSLVKLCDFGLSTTSHSHPNFKYSADLKALPYKWMSPDAMEGPSTPKSDVWSFGILVWEIFELGRQPYSGIRDPLALYDFLKAGKRLSQPAFATADLYQLMLQMWSEKREQRPNFRQIREQLEQEQGRAA